MAGSISVSGAGYSAASYQLEPIDHRKIQFTNINSVSSVHTSQSHLFMQGSSTISELGSNT